MTSILPAKLKKRISIELGHFNSLSENIRRVLLSYGFFLAAFPLLNVFINAYFWRQSQDLTHILTYNTGWFIGLPLGFYLNGLLLRKYHVKFLYFIGAVAQGLGALFAVFSAATHMNFLIVYGIIYGIGGGLFWANKNYLSLRLTRGINRTYYNNIEYAIDLMINIITPIVVGWIIVSGELLGIFTTDFSYRVLMIFAFFLLFTSGYLVYTSNIPDLKVKNLWVKNPSIHWSRVRIYNIIYQSITGINYILPGILILRLIGSEGVLGTVQSMAALLSAFAVYVVGRKSNIKKSWGIMVSTSILYILASLILAFGYDWISLLVFLAGSTISRSLKWSASYTVIMETMDKEVDISNLSKLYAYVFDNEVFFNIGRYLSIILIFIFMTKSQDFALRWTPFVLGVFQLLGLGIFKKLHAYVGNN